MLFEQKVAQRIDRVVKGTFSADELDLAIEQDNQTFRVRGEQGRNFARHFVHENLGRKVKFVAQHIGQVRSTLNNYILTCFLK